jgi:hypothetical protein
MSEYKHSRQGKATQTIASHDVLHTQAPTGTKSAHNHTYISIYQYINIYIYIYTYNETERETAIKESWLESS